MIRWSYVLPRLAILVLVVLAVRFGLDPLLQWSAISFGQRVTTAKVEIGSLETSLWQTEISLHDVAIANPDEPMKNLLEARELKLALERDPLFHKQLIVREGRISGLRFGTERTTSGFLDKPEKQKKEPARPQPEHPRDNRLAQLAEEWLEKWAGLLQAEVEKEIEQLASVRLARELAERWPAEYRQMEARADSLKARAEELRKMVRGDGIGDLLRNVESGRRALNDVESIQRDIAQFRAELDRLHGQALRDKDAVREARERDVEEVRERLHLDDLKGESLSDYLLGPELAENVRLAAQWVGWLREHWPEKVAPTGPTRSRGIDVAFAGLHPRPDFLIQKLAIDGEGELGHEPFQFAGTAEGLTSHPAIYGRPTVLKLDVQAKAKMQIEAVLDRTEEVACDRITVECPDWPQPRQVLGRPERLALEVSPGSTRLSLVLHLRGEELLGSMTLRQEPVELVPAVAPRYGGPRFAADLHETLGRIRTLEVVADLSGTLDDPQWHFRSDLGTQLSSAANGLIQRDLERRRGELTAFVQRKIEDELARFDQMLQSRQEALLAKVNLSGEDLRQLQELIANRLPLPDRLPEKLLGKPLDIPLRF